MARKPLLNFCGDTFSSGEYVENSFDHFLEHGTQKQTIKILGPRRSGWCALQSPTVRSCDANRTLRPAEQSRI